MERYKQAYIAATMAVVFLYAYIQLSLMPDMRQCILEGAGLTFQASAIKSCITQPMVLTIAALTMAVAGITALGWRKGHFTQLYSWLGSRKKEWLIVACITAAAALPYLSKGNVVLGDAMQLTALTIYMKESITSLAYPFWTFYWNMGSAPLAFYGWLHSLVTGAINIFAPADTANKLTFFIAHITSSLLAYKFAKAATGNTKAAVIAGLAYGLSFEHIARIMIGRSLTALTYMLVPLLFLIYEKRLGNAIGRGKAIALTAATIALLIFNHQADAALITAAFALYAALRAIETGKAKSMAAEIGLAIILAITIAAFWAIPMLLESSQASGTAKAIEILAPKAPDASLLKEMALWPGKLSDKQLLYVGASTIFLSCLGAYHLLRQKKYAVVATTLAILMLILIQSTRYTPAFILLLGLAAGHGLIFLTKKLKIDGTKIMLIAAAILTVDMMPATLQLGYPDFSYNKQVYDTINTGDGERILDLSTDRRTFWPAYAYISNRAETVFGTHIESAPRSLPYAAAIASKAAIEHYDKRQNFSEETLQGLYLLGVKYVILHSEQAGKKPADTFAGKRGTLGIERGLEKMELNQSPVIASGRIERITYTPTLENEEGWNLRPKFEQRTIGLAEIETITRLMKTDRSEATADRILVKDRDDEETAAENVTMKIRSTATVINKAEIEYEISDDAFLQLSYSHSPYLSVKIDGKETAFWKTAINTIAVRTEAGQHTITVTSRQTGLRKATLLISAVGLIIFAFLLIRKKC